MSGQIQASGSIVAGPVAVSDSTFPNGVDTIDIKTTPTAKQYTNREHKERTYTVAVDVALDFTGISATFVYIRTSAAMSIKVTAGAGTGVEAQNVYGIYMREFDPANPCTAITITGSGTVEYFIAG